VRHQNPPPGTIVKANPPGLDLWGMRRRAERAPRPSATTLTLSTLVGRTETELRASLGDPELRRAEGEGALETYRLPNCSLMVFLHKEGTAELKVTGAQTGPLERGGQAPDVDACLKSAGGAK
jgi:hypothetical protein